MCVLLIAIMALGMCLPLSAMSASAGSGSANDFNAPMGTVCGNLKVEGADPTATSFVVAPGVWGTSISQGNIAVSVLWESIKPFGPARFEMSAVWASGQSFGSEESIPSVEVMKFESGSGALLLIGRTPYGGTGATAINPRLIVTLTATVTSEYTGITRTDTDICLVQVHTTQIGQLDDPIIIGPGGENQWG